MQHGTPRDTSSEAKPTRDKRAAEQSMPENGKFRTNHWATATYMIVIWGCNFLEILQILFHGLQSMLI